MASPEGRLPKDASSNQFKGGLHLQQQLYSGELAEMRYFSRISLMRGDPVKVRVLRPKFQQIIPDPQVDTLCHLTGCGQCSRNPLKPVTCHSRA